ncbi:MAG TPA: lysylphosphatidylglycerol synthase transmembrane domain-containing protein [Thermoleophilaceae bacterium]|nr:lysylphosphatidylglycerol synthase transmembrane domain-containing protein [Thermoleophilaceae bacterium]
MGAATRRSLGDRLETALEHRADVPGEIARGDARRPSRRRLLRSAAWLAVTAISLYLVAPTLIETLGSWQSLAELTPGWLAVMTASQVAAVLCLWWLQRIATRAGWFAVATSQLASNGVAKIAPGGAAIGAALQYRMLVESGMQRATAVSGLTAANLLTLAIVLALPVLAAPALARGAVNRSLVEGAIGGLGLFLVLFVVGVTMLAFDRPLEWVGRVVQRARNRIRRHAEPLQTLPARLLRERARILSSIRPRWPSGLAAGVGRWAFDYATLLAALAAVGSTPRPALVLLAYCTAQLLAQIPITPGGLGFVEAGLTTTLALAGVEPADAVVATFAYRLFTYWLPLPLALLGVVLHRRRYVRPGPHSADGRGRPM